MHLTPEQITTLVGGLVAVVLAFLEYLRRRLAENTHETRKASAQAEAAQIAAETINRCQVDQAELDMLRRWKAAFDTLPECQACKDAVAHLTERRRVYPH